MSGVSPEPGISFPPRTLHTWVVRRAAVVRCVIAAVLFGAAAPATSRLAGDVPALTLAGLLYVGAALAVLPWIIVRPPSMPALASEWRLATVAVVLGGAAGPALLVAGLSRTSAASASLLLNFELVATVATAVVVFREHLGGRLLGAVALIVSAGIALTWRSGDGLEVGGLLVVAACLCWGVDNAVTARMQRIAPEHIVLFKGAVAGSANLILGLVVAGLGRDTSWHDLAAAPLIGALGYGLSITLWIKGARALGGARAQVIFATAPFVGAAIAWTALREDVTGLQLLAMVLAAVGVAISLRSDHAHAHAHEVVSHDHDHSHDDGHHAHHDAPTASHSHVHEHPAVTHEHRHVPDLHHAHRH